LNTPRSIGRQAVGEEIESMGKPQASGLERHRCRLLTQHLKWRYRPARRSSSRRGTIVEQRARLVGLLRDNQGLQP